MDLNTNTCTEGAEELTYEQCEAYAASKDMFNFVGYYTPDNDYYQYYTNNRSDRPKGCYCETVTAQIFFNEHQEGSSHPDYYPICIEEN